MEIIVTAGTYATFCNKMGIDAEVDYRREYTVELDDDDGIKTEDELLEALNK